MDDETGGPMIKRCEVCERLLHDGDEVVAVVTSVFHSVPSEVMYAIEQPTGCHKLAHAFCVSPDEVQL